MSQKISAPIRVMLGIVMMPFLVLLTLPFASLVLGDGFDFDALSFISLFVVIGCGRAVLNGK